MKLRISPRLFSEMISNLTESQRKWIKDVGFTFLLDFELHMLPGKLSYNILQIFDHNTVSLKLKDAEINITQEDVYDVLGLPHGGLEIILGTEEDYKERINAWHEQFNTEQVTAQKIVQAMKFQSVSDNFKLNFLVLMSNVLIGTTSCSYVDKKLLRFADNLDNLERYNWPEFLLGYLVFATESWNNTASTFFRGSLIFLTVSLQLSPFLFFSSCHVNSHFIYIIHFYVVVLCRPCKK